MARPPVWVDLRSLLTSIWIFGAPRSLSLSPKLPRTIYGLSAIAELTKYLSCEPPTAQPAKGGEKQGPQVHEYERRPQQRRSQRRSPRSHPRDNPASPGQPEFNGATYVEGDNPQHRTQVSRTCGIRPRRRFPGKLRYQTSFCMR